MNKKEETKTVPEKQKTKKAPTKTLEKREVPAQEEKQVVVDADPTTNKFIVETNIFEPWAVASFSLPKILFTKSVNSNEQKIKDKSSIAFELHYVTKPNQPLSILKASKNGVEKFNLHHVDEDGKIQSTWNFINVRVVGIDFGVLSYEADGTEENPWNRIKIELEYERLIVDGFEV